MRTESLRIVQTAPLANGPAKGSAVTPLRILVVDDVPEICAFFRDLRRRIRLDVQLTTECNARRAADLVAAEPFDLVVSDFRMREIDGVEVLQAAKGRNPSGYRVLMTGYNEIPASLGRIRSAGIDAYIQKPLNAQPLLLMLLAFLRSDETAVADFRLEARHLEQVALNEQSALHAS